MREVVRAVGLDGLEALVSDLGGDLSVLAREVGLDPADFHSPYRFLPVRQTHALVNLAADRLGRKDLGLLWGARSDPSRLGPLHVAVMSAETARQAVEILARFMHVNFPTGAVSLKALPNGRDELLGVQSLLQRPPPMIQFYERRLGSLNVILKLVCGDDYRPKQVWFTHKQNAPIDAYQRAFGVRPLFEMPANGIVISRNVLDAGRPSTNEQVREMALSYLRSQAAPVGQSAKAETHYILEILMRSYNPTLCEVARALQAHPRTLQRRLQEEGASFDLIKDDVRKSMAETLLRDPTTTLIEIALGLHYANMSAFSRSCRRWFGMPPSHLRREFRRLRKPTTRARLRRARLRL